MENYINRLKNAWVSSTMFGKIVLIIFLPIWLLSGLNSEWDSTVSLADVGNTTEYPNSSNVRQ